MLKALGRTPIALSSVAGTGVGLVMLVGRMERRASRGGLCGDPLRQESVPAAQNRRRWDAVAPRRLVRRGILFWS
jgi:hypothetical protein